MATGTRKAPEGRGLTFEQYLMSQIRQYADQPVGTLEHHQSALRLQLSESYIRGQSLLWLLDCKHAKT